MDKPKKSLGRDVFSGTPPAEESKAIRRMIEGGARGGTCEVEVRIKLTPSNLKHLEKLREQLRKSGKGEMSRDEIIRVAITLLSQDDF